MLTRVTPARATSRHFTGSAAACVGVVSVETSNPSASERRAETAPRILSNCRVVRTPGVPPPTSSPATRVPGGNASATDASSETIPST